MTATHQMPRLHDVTSKLNTDYNYLPTLDKLKQLINFAINYSLDLRDATARMMLHSRFVLIQQLYRPEIKGRLHVQ